jgi:hypothetical protein
LREGIIYITTTISLRLCVFARIKKEKIIGAQSRQAAKKGELFLCDSAPCPPRWALEEEKNLIPPPQKPDTA